MADGYVQGEGEGEGVTLKDMMDMPLSDLKAGRDCLRVPSGWVYMTDRGGMVFVPEPPDRERDRIDYEQLMNNVLAKAGGASG